MRPPFRSRQLLPLVAATAALLAGCGGEPSSVGDGSPPPATSASPAELRKLEQQASQIVDGGKEAFERRLAALRGHPVVVNQWASWCPPCREELPFFQSLARKYSGEVAFLGVDSADNRGDAEEFLDEFPTPFPHYFDPDIEIAHVFNGGQAFPTTAFYDAAGTLTKTKPGAYATEAKLEEDIKQFALRE